MAGTSGLASSTNGIAQLALAAINGGTAMAITTPLKVLFYSTMRINNNNTSTTEVEWTTASGYTALTGFSGVTFASATTDTTGSHQANSNAITISNCPAQTWAGNKIIDSHATPLETWYAPLTGGNKTINSGDTCTVAIGSFATNLG